MTGREAAVGKNEALFREVNERIRGITTRFSDAEFLCECGDAACAQPISLDLDEYEGVRREPTHFVIVPGHELLEVEAVVQENPRFMIVRKHEGLPTEIALETDPRS